ncbi:sugar phosphate isomerase/epimerase family protein [Amycolatopsis sp. CA-161197]|uniref:sugar phosphate isomerase/epimerase family protein n=1 Tax=Amycolatopsis sp. CA-161197 TaxID=3239922 RepID=UPI003D8C53C6
MTDSVSHLSLDATLDLAAQLGLDYVEFATGNWSSSPHVNLDVLLEDAAARRDLQLKLADRKLRISALTCSGNPLHPGPAGVEQDAVTRKTIELAALLDVDRVVLMSGLPGGPGDQNPNWIAVSWPPEATKVLAWQWDSVVLPYWTDLAGFAEQRGIHKLCVELHGQQVVYNAPTLLRLREAVGPVVGANLDPSHLMWMGGDPLAAVEALGDAIYHVHAKDTRVEPTAAVRTMLETVSLLTDDPGSRAWNYVTLGTGRGEPFWADFVAALAKTGYDDVLSIEHEDTAVEPVAGVRASVDLLRRVTRS